MIEPRIRRRVTRGHKPLSNLRTSEVVRTVVDHPRRLEELVNLLEDRERTVRGRAAATLARLSESYPARLIRIIDRLKEGLSDESDYVRWHMAYSLGRIGSSFPRRSSSFLRELSACLDDENRIVRILASKALGSIAARKPQLVEELFEASKREIPVAVARSLRNPMLKSRKPGRRS